MAIQSSLGSDSGTQSYRRCKRVSKVIGFMAAGPCQSFPLCEKAKQG